MQKNVEEEILIENPSQGTDKSIIFNMLLAGIKQYLSSEDIEKIERAYNVAKECHKGQKRKSGEEYIIHPLCVAITLANLHMDVETIVAGILHDVIEDTEYTYNDVKTNFGESVAILVDGVTKLTNVSLVKDKVVKQAENVRHMFLAMSKDWRVIIIKLADRLHNLRTLEYQDRQKQKEKALETIEIYSPIANRLGITKIKSIMDDLAFRYWKPKEYSELQKNIKIGKEQREKFIEDIVNDVKNKLDDANIKAEVYGRVKNIFSIYNKMVKKNKTLDEIYDLFAIRILVDDMQDCYAALGIIHKFWKSIPGRFKDYITRPKQNNYMSLHTTVFGKNGIPFEIQIRTYEMHKVDELGIAAHWAYKENGNSKGVKDTDELELMNWLKVYLDINNDEKNSNNFLNYVKEDLDLFKSKIYCFTPNGDVITLPQDSTPIDFAYMIHSAVGNKMVGARVNGAMVPIDYKIKNGDIISIITSQNSQGPSRDWLKVVKSPQAKNKIEHWFKTERREENIAFGKELVEKYAKSKKINLSEILKDEYIKEACKKYTCFELDDLYAMIGHGGLKEGQLVSKLKDEYDKNNQKNITDEEIESSIKTNAVNNKKANESSNGVIIRGISGLAIHFSHCCSPVPGDEIIGFITKGRGVTVHRTDCKNIISLSEYEKERLIETEWENEKINTKYYVKIEIFAEDRKGFIADVSRLLLENNIDIHSIDTKKNKNSVANVVVSFEVQDKSEFNKLLSKLRNIQGIKEIRRV